MSALFSDLPLANLGLRIERIIEDAVQARIQQLDSNSSKAPCKFYPKGQCHKSAGTCPFRHSRSEKSVVCKHWLRGLCKKDDLCDYLHEYDLSKMPPCHFFTTFGECSNADCDFLHIQPEDHIRDCPWYQRGFCKHGPNCRNRHVRNEPCAEYMAGFCVKGPKCKFGHPKFERPADDSWVTPPICTRCGNVGHRSNACHADASSERRATELCAKCNLSGHSSSHCPYENRLPSAVDPALFTSKFDIQ